MIRLIIFGVIGMSVLAAVCFLVLKALALIKARTREKKRKTKDEYRVEEGALWEQILARGSILIFTGLIWGVAIALLYGLDALVSIWVSTFSIWDYNLWILIVLGAFTIVTFAKGYATVPESYQWLIQLFQGYVYSAKAGIHFYFPWGRIIEPVQVPVYEQQMPLFMFEKNFEQKAKLEKEGIFGFGAVDFQDSSTPVRSTIYHIIIDPAKAYYNVGLLYNAIEERIDWAIRSFLGMYSLDDGNNAKARANLKNILNNEYIYPDAEQAPEYIQPENQHEVLYNESALYRYIYDRWGVMITQISISDFVYPEETVKAMDRLYEARKNKQAEEYNKESRRLQGEGERDYLAAVGEGMQQKLSRITETGLTPDKASFYDNENTKWINASDKTVIESGGGGGFAGIGAQFAAGQSVFQQRPDSRSGGGSGEQSGGQSQK